MDFNDYPVTKFLYSLDNRDYPLSAKKYCNPNYKFSRFIFRYEKGGVSFVENESDEIRTPEEIIDKLYMMKNACRQPVVISKSFYTVMERSEDAFTPFHNDILEECEGEIGVVRAPYLVPGTVLLYAIEDGKLSVWVVLNHKKDDKHIHAPSAYISAFPIDKKKGIGHELVVDYLSLIDGCLEHPYGLYSHAFTILTYLCLRKWAEVEIKEVTTLVEKIVKKNKKPIIIKENGLSYFTFDSKWYTEICNNNDFKVSGHFRLQPYGDGSRKLIYIEEFVKHGYHRKASIDKVKDGELTIE